MQPATHPESHANTLICRGKLERPNSHVSGLFKEVRVPRENPCANREKMETPGTGFEKRTNNAATIQSCYMKPRNKTDFENLTIVCYSGLFCATLVGFKENISILFLNK